MNKLRAAAAIYALPPLCTSTSTLYALWRYLLAKWTACISHEPTYRPGGWTKLPHLTDLTSMTTQVRAQKFHHIMSVFLAESAAIEADNTPFSDYEIDGESQSPLPSEVHRYFLPSDETEQGRIDLAHHLVTMMRGGSLHMAPIGDDEDPPNVLDTGTGTGIWALDFGDIHPAPKSLVWILRPYSQAGRFKIISSTSLTPEHLVPLSKIGHDT
ncbi:hypothetical protein EX30DRAFT_364128 [Ascodesmis nigricans]|uniref:Methyltransferase domain-containing protein n=1 Tax=Ascodesmis nigricans TaxID=341454 RepID=A0A4S2MWV5_9PEZI|nr:hypothetical protein EX30DRAFT_364128 [Ascodesmis nigricans]